MDCNNCALNNHPHTTEVTESGRCLCCGLIVDWSGFAPRVKKES